MSKVDLDTRLFARAQPLKVGRLNRFAGMLGGVVLVFAVWASFASLEEQVRAPGTVVVSSRSQVVQVVDGGVLRKLHVHEGDEVKQGDLLAELDTVRFEASSDEIQAKAAALQATMERDQAELDGRPLRFSEQVSKYPEIVASQKDLYEKRVQGHREEIGGIQKSLALANQQAQLMEELHKTGDASLSEVLTAQKSANDIQATLTNKKNQYRQDLQTEQAKSRAELESTIQVLAGRNAALHSTNLRAPMSGVVKNVKITTLGAVLKPADELLQIVPSDDPILVEAKVKSADVAFVRKDLKANVKLSAYDYTIYGSLKGHVTYISPDTVVDEQQRQQSKDEEPTYRVHIQIDQLPEQHKDKIEIIPGMAATVEIITGDRTVAQYLLKPLRRISSEALVER